MVPIRNFYVISPMLACSGQPDDEQLKDVAAKQFQAVVNLGLADADYALHDEATLVKQLGMDYLHIPVLFNSPQTEDLLAFINYMDTQRDRKVLVHCAANYRAICFTGLYLYYLAEFDEGQMMDMIGEIWQPDHTWQMFIEEGMGFVNELKEH